MTNKLLKTIQTAHQEKIQMLKKLKP